VDDSRFPDVASVHSPDARNAVAALCADKAVPVAVTRPFGCSTKWIGHNETQDFARAWNSAPVTIENIDAAGVAKLVKNPTSKLRVINVWATWCAPCVAEFPSLVSISQRMANRDFELITISVDDPKDVAKAKAFLEQQHAAVSNRLNRSLHAEGRTTNNYLFTGSSIDALMQALDPSSPGPVPYTIMIAPGGKIIYRSSGPVDARELLAKVVDTLGPYYPKTGR
jgi:thiol-disulfide isomerase/thioredoxin